MGLFSKKKEETKSCCCGGNCTPETMTRAEAAKTSAGVKVLGTGCAKCKALEDAVHAALTELGMDTSIDHVALPVELSRVEQLALVRSFVKDNFVDAGMCADFAIHDKGTGNPHAHILLTIRPIKENGEWGAKCRKVYDLDGQGQRIPDGKGGWKSHREDTTDWNQRGNAEKWRAA